jgi:adenylylsulfate kinase
MLLIQMSGLSGAGKSTISQMAKSILTDLGYKVELLDDDECHNRLCPDLGNSKADSLENIHRLGFVGLTLAKHGVITLLVAVNPYKEARTKLHNESDRVKTVFVDCPLSITTERDPKGLYRRAILPENHPNHLAHFTGISDPFEIPEQPDLIISTETEFIADSAAALVAFILKSLEAMEIAARTVP